VKRTHGVASRRRPSDVTETRESPDAGPFAPLTPSLHQAPSSCRAHLDSASFHRSAFFATVPPPPNSPPLPTPPTVINITRPPTLSDSFLSPSTISSLSLPHPFFHHLLPVPVSRTLYPVVGGEGSGNWDRLQSSIATRLRVGQGQASSRVRSLRVPTRMPTEVPSRVPNRHGTPVPNAFAPPRALPRTR